MSATLSDQLTYEKKYFGMETSGRDWINAGKAVGAGLTAVGGFLAI